MRPRPVWAPGRLYIGGIGLAKGYWADPARTAESFITHPRTGQRLYRTGDLGRYLPDGNIEFLGREDFQVKIQGYRIELGEVENALSQCPLVTACVVAAQGEHGAEKKLVAYVVPVQGKDVTAEELRKFVAMRLPDYMIPAAFVSLAALPLSANGKIDRKNLPAHVFHAEPAAVAMADSPTASIAAIVGIVLNRPAPAPSENLMYLGASSIDMIRIGNALSAEMDFYPKLDQFFLDPTVANLARMREQALGSTLDEKAIRIVTPQRENGRDVSATISDPDERARFKNAEHGYRRMPEDNHDVALSLQDIDRDRYSQFRSVRAFSPEPVSGQALSYLLGQLFEGELAGQKKFLYPSAGGLYPVQAYLYVKPGRVTGVQAGAYYYDRKQHRLHRTSELELPSDAYDYFVNRPTFDAAAFSLFLVADLGAIEPIYGGKSVDFCHIEAGTIAQLLAMAASDCKLGLCGIGSVDFEQMHALFDLGERHRIVYSMVGGGLGSEGVGSRTVMEFSGGDTRDEFESGEI